jgi:hypothetical protein
MTEQNPHKWKVGKSRQFANQESRVKKVYKTQHPMLKSEIGLIKAQAKRQFIQLIKEDEQLINKEFGQVTHEVFEDMQERLRTEDTADTERIMKIVLTEQMKHQFLVFAKMIDKEMEKKKPNPDIIKWAQGKKQDLIINGMDLLRKMNEGEHEMRYGKKKININTDLPTLEEWSNSGKVITAELEVIDEDKPAE